MQRGDAGPRGESGPSGMEWDRSRFHHTTQISVQFKAYELCISTIFHLVFWTAVDHG